MATKYPHQWAESANSYYFQVKLPGFENDDIDINIDHGTLKISADKAKEEEDEEEINNRKSNINEKEAFKYNVDLPADKICLSKVHAFIQQGLLIVKCPKLTKSDLPSLKVQLLKNNL
ncbi:hypothetical protein K502DRAFT_329653 [Neoconidiobolus thromboides FSU 785]|nr:hypothetical protein K502DRAFT_329653 [Neoconidiobolus thromboides FSU 785]